MGSGSYSFAVYASLASDRGYATKSADAVFTNHSLSAKSDIKLSNVDARTYNTQIKPEMVDTGVRERVEIAVNTQRLLRLSLPLMLLVQCVEHLMK